MVDGKLPEGLQLTEDEAFALLAMCLMSPQSIDRTVESALRKLAEYCIVTSIHKESITNPKSRQELRELKSTGA